MAHWNYKRSPATRWLPKQPMSAVVMLAVLTPIFLEAVQSRPAAADERPNIVLVMADDQGWGQTGYYDHPLLKTPELDAMAASGLRFDRFYAAAPVCSPTRASVLTGRSNRRTGVESHGYALRLQEKTLSTALRDAGYRTAHFGKWHLNGLRGPGVPILAEDRHGPAAFGFDRWISVTNFFDRDPIMSDQGRFIEYSGDSSEIVVAQALAFMKRQAAANSPFLSVIWYGSPHNPFRATDADAEAFDSLNPASRDHHGELVAMDRSIGTLRRGLRALGLEEKTLVWFCSDNGGLPRIQPDTVGGLRGNKGTIYEGGLRVPCIVEWPGKIQPRVTSFPSVVMDIFPTIAEIVGLPNSAMLQPQDGISLRDLFAADLTRRAKPIPFSCFGNSALLDNRYKLIHFGKPDRYELYDLDNDPTEARNLYAARPELAAQLKKQLAGWTTSLEASIAGKDYPEGRVLPENPEPRFWMEVDAYRPHFETWRRRPEYRSRLAP